MSSISNELILEGENNQGLWQPQSLAWMNHPIDRMLKSFVFFKIQANLNHSLASALQSSFYPE